MVRTVTPQRSASWARDGAHCQVRRLRQSRSCSATSFSLRFRLGWRSRYDRNRPTTPGRSRYSGREGRATGPLRSFQLHGEKTITGAAPCLSEWPSVWSPSPTKWVGFRTNSNASRFPPRGVLRSRLQKSAFEACPTAGPFGSRSGAEAKRRFAFSQARALPTKKGLTLPLVDWPEMSPLKFGDGQPPRQAPIGRVSGLASLRSAPLRGTEKGTPTRRPNRCHRRAGGRYAPLQPASLSCTAYGSKTILRTSRRLPDREAHRRPTRRTRWAPLGGARPAARCAIGLDAGPLEPPRGACFAHGS